MRENREKGKYSMGVALRPCAPASMHHFASAIFILFFYNFYIMYTHKINRGWQWAGVDLNKENEKMSARFM